MKKKYIGMILLLVSSLGIPVYAAEQAIYLEDKKIEMDVEVEMYRNTTYVPIAFVANELGASVQWKQPQIIITQGKNTIVCTVGDCNATINGEHIAFYNAPYISNGRTYVPLRFISEQLGCSIQYDEQTESILLTKNATPTNKMASEVKAEDFIVSPDGQWGYLIRSGGYTGGERVFYMRNMEFGTLKEIYSTINVVNDMWVNDSRLLICGKKDVFGVKDGRHLMIYDPVMGEMKNIVYIVSYGDEYHYIKSMNVIIFYCRNARNTQEGLEGGFGLYDLTTEETEVITESKFMELKALVEE